MSSMNAKLMLQLEKAGGIGLGRDAKPIHAGGGTLASLKKGKKGTGGDGIKHKVRGSASAALKTADAKRRAAYNAGRTT